MSRIARFLTVALTCSAVAVVLASTAGAATTTGIFIAPHQNKYVSNGDYGVRSDDFGSLTWLDNMSERGFTITSSTANGSRVTAYPNVFRGWQWGVGTGGAWPVRVSAEIMIFLSHPHVLTGGKKIRVDRTDWYVNERKTTGHGVT
jgi:hypothetical protein